MVSALPYVIMAVATTLCSDLPLHFAELLRNLHPLGVRQQHVHPKADKQNGRGVRAAKD